MKETSKSKKKSKFKLLHQYYSYTGFYSFVGKSVKKALLPIAIVIVIIFLFNNYVYNVNEGLKNLTDTFTATQIFVTFFLSESFLGLIPPELFIAWTKKTTEPVINLAILAVFSYVGGIISFYIGKTILKIEKVKNYLEVKMAKQLKNIRKWGGFLIVVGALLPIPFSITCMAAGMIKYPLKGVLTFGLLRFARFAIYALAIFQVVS
ncbi:short-chain dehydrogenase [Lutibacter sp. TH_r2]|uniref:YqaA family protein n=1 Tax=Lutibacter sp. TH_r2 TaxID=3082083 RepID=UPI0029536F59|nr:short-chain dehydrogenase [Lutibacter sp. TH_r2]MDV7185994.1 short-chain dehydrogenase [Lutibacter sp. TH_r2]